MNDCCGNCIHWGSKILTAKMPGARIGYRKCNKTIHGINRKKELPTWTGPDQWCDGYERKTNVVAS